MFKYSQFFLKICKQSFFKQQNKRLLFSSAYLFSKDDKNEPKENIALQSPDIKDKAAEALKKSMNNEEKKFTLDNKTFTANIGEHTLTYTLDDSIQGTQYGVGGFYVIMFTCEVCETKSVKSFSKSSYHQGVVLIRCEGCDKLHLIADNLAWFEDKPVNVEDLMARKGKPMIKISDNPEIASIFSQFMQNKKKV